METRREVVVKFQYGNDVRRLTFLHDHDHGHEHEHEHEQHDRLKPLAYVHLVDVVERLYEAGSLPRDFRLTYIDDEGDSVGITGDEELKAAIANLPTGKVLRIAIVDPNAPPAPTGTLQTDLSALHNVLCNHCKRQVQGIRFVCINCADYSLCAQCEALRQHDVQHLFLKVYLPLPPHTLQILPLPNFYAPDSASQPGAIKSIPNWMRQSKTSNGMDVSNKLAARFVEDLTVEDGYEATPGEPFVKIWRMRNIGNTAWPEGITMAWVSGDNLSSVGDSVPVIALPAGGEVDVSVPMLAPLEPGRYVSNWRLRSPSGVFFGHRVWVDMMVKHATQVERPNTDVEEEVAAHVQSNDLAGDLEIESEWERQSVKVRKISKIRRSHSDVESDDEDLACQDSFTVQSDEQMTPAEITRDGWELKEESAAISIEQEQSANEATPQDTNQNETRENPTESAQSTSEQAVTEEPQPTSSKPTEGVTSGTAEEGWEMVTNEQEGKWAEELALLREMGIGNLDSIRKALEQSDGNVQLAAQSLLGE